MGSVEGVDPDCGLTARFALFLETERGAAGNTRLAYVRDVRSYLGRLREWGLGWKQAETETVQRYLEWMQKESYRRSSMMRAVASIKTFHRFLLREGETTEDPTALIQFPRTGNVVVRSASKGSAIVPGLVPTAARCSDEVESTTVSWIGTSAEKKTVTSPAAARRK